MPLFASSLNKGGVYRAQKREAIRPATRAEAPRMVEVAPLPFLYVAVAIAYCVVPALLAESQLVAAQVAGVPTVPQCTLA